MHESNAEMVQTGGVCCCCGGLHEEAAMMRESRSEELCASCVVDCTDGCPSATDLTKMNEASVVVVWNFVLLLPDHDFGRLP